MRQVIGCYKAGLRLLSGGPVGSGCQKADFTVIRQVYRWYKVSPAGLEGIPRKSVG